MKKLICIFPLLFCFGCGLGTAGKEDDTATTSSESTSITDNDTCPVNLSVEEAVEEAEEVADEEAESVEEVPSSPVFRVHFREVVITVNGCDNSITVNDNDTTSDDDTTVLPSEEG